ncbi:TauD/TfdA family dioxygenase [Lentzea terrae]|uniref:TauD/TfdA family dioxygenase n=1 Tax=Lentzea terrae TaxID=2200761 RepID=UPI000DD360C5|nr:TauD/TfdA family dioxygenase [Lentzea terrae]
MNEPALPAWVRGLVNHVRKTLEVDGYAHLRSLPAEFDHRRFATSFGTPMPQYDGELVWDLRPQPDLDDVYDSRNTRALVPHTEGYELDTQPPQFVVLWCVRPAQGEGGETLLADGKSFVDGLAAEDRARLASEKFDWRSSEGLARQGIELNATHPALEEVNGRLLIRFSENNVLAGSDTGLLERYVKEGRTYFDEACFGVRLDIGDLLIWDNWRMLHSRSAFTDRRRHLRRMLIAA